MANEDRKALASDIATGIAQAHKQESPINPQNIFYGLGLAAVAYVGWSFNHAVEGNSEKLDALAENVNRLVIVTQQQQNTLGERGDWMKGVDTYSEESRIHDQRHDQDIAEIKERLGRAGF